MNTRALTLSLSAAHGSLLLSPRPRHLHLRVDGGHTRGPSVQQCHPEAELVLRPEEAWFKDPGTEKDELVGPETH